MNNMPEKGESKMIDSGHENLILDLEALLKEAQDYQFHDFKNSSYATPKVALYNRLFEIADSVKKGKYDNI